MRVLVTGNKGFIATCLNRELQRQGHEVLGFDLHDDFEPLRRHHYDIVYHLAAIARTAECFNDPFGQPHRSNIELTCDLLERFSFDKIIYTSSCAIYGDQPTLPITENSLPNPPSVYGAQKLMSEKYVHFTRMHSKRVSVCLRLFNVYGELQSKAGSYPNVIASFLRSLNTKGYIEVTGDGTQSRDFVYVDDVINALLLASEISSGNFIFNVGTGVQTPILEVAKTLSSDIRFIDQRPFDILHQVADYSHIRTVLGWEPRIALSEGLERIKCFEANSPTNGGKYLS